MCCENIFLSIFIASYIQHKPKIIEGEIRAKQLFEYLEHLNLRKCVWLCEDATGINSRIQYDPITNQLIGLALPINSITGMPVSFSYVFKSLEAAQMFINKPKSSLVYVVLAQPIMQNVPPFVLQIFGTDNKFTSVNVVNRWKHTTQELEKYEFWNFSFYFFFFI